MKKVTFEPQKGRESSATKGRHLKGGGEGEELGYYSLGTKKSHKVVGGGEGLKRQEGFRCKKKKKKKDSALFTAGEAALKRLFK